MILLCLIMCTVLVIGNQISMYLVTSLESHKLQDHTEFTSQHSHHHKAHHHKAHHHENQHKSHDSHHEDSYSMTTTEPNIPSTKNSGGKASVASASVSTWTAHSDSKDSQHEAGSNTKHSNAPHSHQGEICFLTCSGLVVLTSLNFPMSVIALGLRTYIPYRLQHNQGYRDRFLRPPIPA